MFASHDAKVKALETENKRLRRYNRALVVRSRDAEKLHSQVFDLQRSNNFLEGFSKKMPELRAQIKELRARNKGLSEAASNDKEKAELKIQVRVLKGLVEDDAKMREKELAECRAGHERELRFFSREIFKKTKALYAPLIGKVRAYLAARVPTVCTLLRLTRQEGAMISLNALEGAGVEVPEDLRLQTEVAHEEARTAVITEVRADVTEQDLAEPDRLATYAIFVTLASGCLELTCDAFRFSLREIVDEVRRAYQADTAEGRMPISLDEDDGTDFG